MSPVDYQKGMDFPQIDHRRFSLRIAGMRQVVENRNTGESYVVELPDELIVPAGAFVAIVGKSGSGKSILLSVLGLLRGCTSASTLNAFQMWFHDEPQPIDLLPTWNKDDQRKAETIRRQRLGFAPQSGELLKSLTIAQNLAVPLRLNGFSISDAKRRTDELLRAFELIEPPDDTSDSNDGLVQEMLARMSSRRLDAISGGQYQRVALARAIAHQPEFLFVDEPTANLDPETASRALELLRAYASSMRPPRTVFMITHDVDLAKQHCNYFLEVHRQTDPVTKRPVGRVQPLRYVAN